MNMSAIRVRTSQIILALIFLCFLENGKSPAQEPASGISPAAKAYLEQALDLMQKEALHKKSVDWAKVRNETLAHAKGAQTTFDAYPAIAFALTQLQEHHSWMQLPDSMPADKRQAISAEMMKISGKTQTDPKPSPFFPQKEMQEHIDRYEGKVFAHVFVPMCVGPYADWEKNGPYFQEFVDKLHGLVMDLQSQKPQGWIIDLRGNGGGNMWPMLAGIGIVIGEGDLGAFISADDERAPWFYRSGKAGVRMSDGKEEVSSEMKQPPFAFSELPWVALLFDRGTGSSGEAVAISFAGRPRARSFGEHTGGFSTSNQMYPLSDGASLFLCNGIEADRTGKLYPDGLEPDTNVPGTDTRPAEENDAVMLAAEQWLAKQIMLATESRKSAVPE
jgi:carboxyl-terminal processing protease